MRDDLILSTVLLRERIRLSGLVTSGPHNRYLVSFLKGYIARIGGLRGSHTYRLLPTHSCGEAKWASLNFVLGVPNFGEYKSLWLIFFTCLVKFTAVDMMYREIHEDRSVFQEKSTTLGFSEHISPHLIFWKRGVSWAVDDVNIALLNFVLDKKYLCLMCVIPFTAERRPLTSRSWALLYLGELRCGQHGVLVLQ